MRNEQWIVLCLAVLLTAGCVQQGPQRPSRRMGAAPEADSTMLAMLELNRQLAATADEQVRQTAMKQEEPYALYEANTWMHIRERGEKTDATITEEGLTVHMRVYTLDGKMLEDTEQSYLPGKRELPVAVEANLNELFPGGNARLIAPWYTAFGLQGTKRIPPYENVIIDIELK